MDGIKITVDNNFFNQDLLAQPQLIKYFEDGKVSFYPSLELIGELLDMHGNADSNKKEALRGYSEIFLRMRRKRILTSWCDLLLNDVGIKQSLPYIDIYKWLEEKLDKILYKLTKNIALDKGEEDLVTKIKERVNSGKCQMGIKYNEAKALYQIKDRYQNFNFEDFYNRNCEIIQKIIVKKMYADNQKLIEENTVNDIVKNQSTRIYFNLYSRIYGAFVFYHFIENQKEQGVDGTDFYDHLYFIYLADVDYLITHDLRSFHLARHVFPQKKKVIKSNELPNIFKKLRLIYEK